MESGLVIRLHSGECSYNLFGFGLSGLGTAALIIAVAVVLPSTQVLGGGSGGGGDNPCTEGSPGCASDPPDPINFPNNAPCAYTQPENACTGGNGVNCHCNTQGGLSTATCVCDDT